MPHQKYALIGFPLSHSISPWLHRRLFAVSQISADYSLLEIPPGRLKENRNVLERLDGYNVTIPHKCEIIPHMDELSEIAEIYGAVNTVTCGEKKKGYNTDGTGLLKALSFAGISLSGHVAVCGGGGVARVMIIEAVKAGCGVTVAVRESGLAAARKLCKTLRSRWHADLTVTSLNGLEGSFDLLLNATPLGMFPSPGISPVSGKALENCRAVFDAVYNPTETALLKAAGKRGIYAVSGLSMLVWQAAAAQEIWNGVSFSHNDMETLISEARQYIELSRNR